MSSESVCQVARSWVDMGSFHMRLVVRFMIYSISPGYFGYTLVGVTFPSNFQSICTQTIFSRKMEDINQ
jgi:hypothetical protein